MNKQVIYIHGKGGTSDEAVHYKPLFTGYDVVGFDYKSQTPWGAEKEFPAYFDGQTRNCDEVILIANSIGAYFSMASLYDKKISQAFFISPIVDMEKLITDMMKWENITEQELCDRKEIPTKFGETLSWEYLCYVRKHPIKWDIPTYIIYGDCDDLTSHDTVKGFAESISAELSIMKGGEHWFHTDEQMEFIDETIKNHYKGKIV
ncbi:alpha/beta hydrolase [Ruminococcus sp.]|uniref:alpha/beta hydrolase n=1 Tax=Ruminococcus sp. TaxID=41978 RepID=UPI0025846D46|nr:alpha/beta hydrolase [Ruminococcus sp.]MCR5021728.1 alpha/beta hydrolase [Ruminococcus sp.]